ncbi:acyltransferase family protein [Clostridium sp. P21]|uniref:Acyltransferase family protein n=1 Tax=Clostridium muellerianum TaxID=2716538 RepID=A0A7Y0EFQ0_9CLOT|nr:acyltransferase family protein [Clostridium muellerianum]NMM62615.1 acyltransferase family protein [Clostridium muellerianum]
MNLKKHRNYYFDNLKLLLIILVVMGHVIEPLIGSYKNVKELYMFIYSFHMPLFIFVSGYFSKNVNDTKKFFPKINKIIVPYIIFQLLYSIFNIYVLKTQNFKITFAYPYWVMWYLLSLFMWTIILPYFSKIKYSILIALVVSIVSGYDDNIGYYLSLSRTITFFPYFLMGYFCKKEYIYAARVYIKKMYAVFGLSVIWLFIYLMNSKIDYRWFYGSYSYSQLNGFGCPKFITEMLVYVLAVIASVCIVALIPNKKLFFTKFGSRTMSVYIFHGFIVKLLVKYNFFNHISSFTSEILVVLISLLIVVMLSSKKINEVTNMIVSPKILKQAS